MDGVSIIQLLILTQSLIIRFIHIPQTRSLQLMSAYSKFYFLLSSFGTFICIRVC
jgi:hypothetical protein